MICPICGGKTGVTDSRAETDHISRRRKCAECEYTFATIELDLDMFERLTRTSCGEARGEEYPAER